METVKIEKTIYHPVYDITTGKYIDQSPFECHSRNNISYTCLCNHKEFNTLTSYKSHIKNKCHLRFIENYYLHIEETNDAKSNSNNYQAKYELSCRKNEQLLKENNEIKKELFQYKLLNLILKYKYLKLNKNIEEDTVTELSESFDNSDNSYEDNSEDEYDSCDDD